MGEPVKKARKLRPIIERAVSSAALSDEDREIGIDLFPKWSGDGVTYSVDAYVQFDGLLYRCVQAHTSQLEWTPTEAVNLWTRSGNPTEEYPEWIRPTGAHDAYHKGDKVLYNGIRYVSTIDENVWTPPTLWEEVSG